jgi:uncharacterized membrane protein
LLGSGAALAADAYAAAPTTRQQEADAPQPIYSTTINKPPEEVYAFFRRLENLPLVMDYLEHVEDLGGGRTRWVARLPVGTVAWHAVFTEDRPGEALAWKTVGSPLAHQGRVTFARVPGGGPGTEVRVEMTMGLPGIAPSEVLARVFTKPQIKGDLRRLKQVLETGEVMFSDASSHARPHPSQPSIEGTKHARARAEDSRAALRAAPEGGLS